MSKSKPLGSFDSMARRRQRHNRNLKRQRNITPENENYDTLDYGGDDMPGVTLIRSARGSGITVARNERH